LTPLQRQHLMPGHIIAQWANTNITNEREIFCVVSCYRSRDNLRRLNLGTGTQVCRANPPLRAPTFVFSPHALWGTAAQPSWMRSLQSFQKLRTRKMLGIPKQMHGRVVPLTKEMLQGRMWTLYCKRTVRHKEVLGAWCSSEVHIWYNGVQTQVLPWLAAEMTNWSLLQSSNPSALPLGSFSWRKFMPSCLVWRLCL